LNKSSIYFRNSDLLPKHIMSIAIIDLNRADVFQRLDLEESQKVVGGYFGRFSTRKPGISPIKVDSTPTSNTYSTRYAKITASNDGITAQGFGYSYPIAPTTAGSYAFGDVTKDGNNATAIAGGSSPTGRARGLNCQCTGIVCNCRTF
jgi:hypothetical protein